MRITLRYNTNVPTSVRPLFLLYFLSLSLSSCHKPLPATIAITHATIIDATGAPPKPNSTILIDHEKISAIGPDSSLEIPPGARTIDATGKFLIPGLADMHIHLMGAGEPTGSREFILPLLIANGITTVRDMGGDVTQLKKLKSEIDSGDQPGPQIFFTGPYLDGNPPYFQPSIVVVTPAEADAAVRKLKSEGVDFIKVQSRLKPDAYFAIAEAARKENIRFVGHVPDSISAAQASDAGQSSIEHLTGILLACSSREAELRQQQLDPPRHKESPRQTSLRQRAWQQAVLNSYSPEKAQKLYAKFLANHTWQVPTLPLLIELAFLTPGTDRSNDPNLKYIPQNLQKIWKQGRAESLANKTPGDFLLRAKLVEASLKAVGDMHAAGIPIMAGTDSTAPNLVPGFALHDSIADLVRAGLTPMQALQAATSRPAEFLLRSTEQGTIAPGQRADLVLLDADPLADIHNTQKIQAVFLKGKYLDRAVLDALLNKAAQFAATP
ncbi:MAG TPA: amidohydrolase family protein [Candidatus Baltobacteraceae bacterium]|nr:amidohydrolase family protein [Candidatus Baltobacteraceae bacterium]